MKFNFLEAPTETRLPRVINGGQHYRDGVAPKKTETTFPSVEISEEWLKAIDEFMSRPKIKKLMNRPVVDADLENRLLQKPANNKK